MDKSNKLGTQSIGKLLASFSIPAVIAMLVNAIYNVVDRIFIGQYVGESALAGLTIVFPIMIMLFAFAGLIGQGGASLISIRFGENDKDGANKIFGNMLVIAVSVSIILAGLMFANIDSLLRLFGADINTSVYASDYLSIILVGIIFQILSFVLNGIVRSEGQPMLSMLSMISAAFINIILDYMFIVKFGWGVQGAALATIIGQFVGFILLVQYFIRGKSLLKITRDSVKIDLNVVKQIILIGATTFMSTIGTSLAMLVLNRSLGSYGGVSAITSMGAINSSFTLFVMPLFGLQQGMQPIIGYNHGAKLHHRVKQTMIYSLGVGVVFSSLVFLFIQSKAELLMGLFLDPSSATMDLAISGLKIFTLVLPLLPINLLATSYFQSIAEGKKAILLGALRQFVILIPLVLILPRILGLQGVWYATPIADGIAILVSIVMLYMSMKNTVLSNTDENFEIEASIV